MYSGSGHAGPGSSQVATAACTHTSSRRILLLMACFIFRGSFTATLSTLHSGVPHLSAVFARARGSGKQGRMKKPCSPHRLSAAQCSARALSRALSSSQLCTRRSYRSIGCQYISTAKTLLVARSHLMHKVRLGDSAPPITERILRKGLCRSSCCSCSWHLLVLHFAGMQRLYRPVAMSLTPLMLVWEGLTCNAAQYCSNKRDGRVGQEAAHSQHTTNQTFYFTAPDLWHSNYAL